MFSYFKSRLICMYLSYLGVLSWQNITLNFLTVFFLPSNVNRATRYTYHWESALQCFNSSNHQMAWKCFQKGWTFYLWQDTTDVDFSEGSCGGKMLLFSQNFEDAKLNKNLFTCNLLFKSTKPILVGFKKRGKTFSLCAINYEF